MNLLVRSAGWQKRDGRHTGIDQITASDVDDYSVLRQAS